MRIVRRFVFTAAFLVATVLMIRAARQYGDFVFLFYPGIMREVQVFLSELTAQLSYVLWERLALIALVWAGITLLLDLILQENLLRWISGITALAAFALCVYVGFAGLNHYAPSVAEGMRLEVQEDYTTDDLYQAAVYFRDGANRASHTVSRGPDGLFTTAEFDTLAEQVGSGMKHMVRTSYVFGGSAEAPKPLGFLSRYDIPGIYSCFTGECCVNPQVDDAALPFVMSYVTAHRMSIARDGDAAFIAVLSCIASDSPDYIYSGYLMAYRFCLEALSKLDAGEAQRVAEGEGEKLSADLAACTYQSSESFGSKLITWSEKLERKKLAKVAQPPDLTTLLVSWYRFLTTPVEAAA